MPNAADLDLFRPERRRRADRSSCRYFGTMGEANDLTAAVEAARLLPDVTFVLHGRRQAPRRAGARAHRRTWSSRRGADKEDVARLAAASAACLTLFKDVPVLATNSPNKLFDTFAAGRPAIVNMDGWMRELVEQNDAGLYVRAGDAPDLAEKIAWLRDHPEEAARMGRNARGARRARVRPRRARRAERSRCSRRRRADRCSPTAS